MPLFTDLTYARPSNVYQGSPLNEVKALNEQASKDYNLARSAKDELDMLYSNLDVEDRNVGIKKQAIEGLRNRFKNLVANGNYQDAKYEVAQAQKDFMTDKQLQDALASKQAKNAYHAQLQDRLKKGMAGEKGGITERQYNYAVQQSELNNKKPLVYNPEKLKSENMFQGINLSDDLSQEISDQTFKRIEDWKANGTTDINGRTYTIQNIGGVQKVMLDGKEVPYSEVANALKQDILNNEAYKSYINEDKEINKFNRTFDGRTGERRNIDRNDLDFLTDAELKQMYLGASEQDIEKLKKSKDLKDKATLNELKTLEKGFDLNNPDIVNRLYDEYYVKDKLNKFVYPAAEKASFQDYNQKIFTDEAALLGLKHKYDKDLEKFKKKLNDESQPPIVTNNLQFFTGEDYATKKNNINSLKDKLTLAKQNFDKAPNDSQVRNDRLQEYNDALREYNIASADLEGFYHNIPVDYKQKIKDNINTMFVKPIGAKYTNWDNRISKDKLNSLIEEAQVNKDTKAQSALMTAKMYLENGKELPEKFVNDLTETITSEPKYLSIVDEADDERASRGTVLGLQQSGFTNGMQSTQERALRSIGGLGYFTSDKTTIGDILREAHNEKAFGQAPNIYSVPYNDNVKMNSSLVNSINDYSKALLGNESDLIAPDGKQLGEYISQKHFWKRNEAGKWVEDTPNLSKSRVGTTSARLDGKLGVAITPKNDKGEDLVESDGTPSDDKGGRKSIIVTPKNAESVKNLYKMQAQYAAETKDYDKSLLLQGYVNFGDIGGKIKLGTDVKPFEINNPYTGEPLTISLRKVDNNTSEVLDASGRPLFVTKDGKNHSYFKSNDELIKNLELLSRPN